MRRAERLVWMTKSLLDHPNQPLSLSDLSVGLTAAKSSLSEDVAVVRQVLEAKQAGQVLSIPGAAGGVKYLAGISESERAGFIHRVRERLTDPARILPGGFLYMLDVLADPEILDYAGRLFAREFVEQGVHVVVTVETKGIPLAVATAHYLHVPVVVVRREHRVTDGPVISVHYVSGSTRRIQTMSLSKRAMPLHARALIVDDFMKAGATVKAVHGLLAEFSASVVGTAVFMATAVPTQKLVATYDSLFRLGSVEEGQPIVITSS